MKDLLICLYIICTNVLVYSESFLKKEQQTIVLISFDGFRHDYIEKYDLQNFKKLSQNGVKASELEPTFVTKTFPNHFTIVTGLYEETHGIVSNRMYDPLYKEEFDVSNTDPKWWNATTPIWIENEIKSRHQVQIQDKYKSATIFWPGSEVRYNNKYPYFTFKKYNPHYSFQARFDKIVELLLDDYPVNFMAAYFEEPDQTSHKYGINSTQLKLKLSSIDKLFGHFLQKIQRANLYNKVIIVTFCMLHTLYLSTRLLLFYFNNFGCSAVTENRGNTSTKWVKTSVATTSFLRIWSHLLEKSRLIQQ